MSAFASSRAALGLLTTISFFAVCGEATAQTTNGPGTSGVMWGTGTPSLGSGGLDSAAAHNANGNAAGQVEAAKRGWLLGSNITVTSIGVQNIITVTGENNTVNANQNGTNNGSVSNNGTITSGR